MLIQYKERFYAILSSYAKQQGAPSTTFSNAPNCLT